MFDAYRKWLGIPAGQRPPTHYQLLGIAPDEQDCDVINAAVVRQSAFVRNFQTGEHGADAARLLNEIAAAKICLLDAAKRAQYDARLTPPAKPAPPGRAGVNPNQRSSSLTAPQSELAPGRRSAAMRPVNRSTPSVEAYPLRAPRSAAQSPAVDSASGIWTDLESLPAPQPAARLTPVKKKPLPEWQWALPVAVGVPVVVALLIAVLTRKPAAVAVVGQLHPATTATSPPAPPAVPSQAPPTYFPSAAPLPTARPGPTFSPSPQAAFPVTTTPDSSAAPASRNPADGNPAPTTSASAASPFNTPAAVGGPSPIVSPGEETSVEVEGPSWSDGSTYSITAPSGAAITFAHGNGPFVAVGQEVYSLPTGKPVGRTGRMPRPNVSAALSADGKYFAIADAGTLEVRDTKTGNALDAWQAASNLGFVEIIGFADADHLITSAPGSGVQVWKISTGKPIKEVKVEGHVRSATLSNDGRYLALAVMNYGIVIYDVLRGPTRGKGKISARIPIVARERSFFDVAGMSFSSSGEEIAALCENGARLLCWDKTTRLAFEHVLATSAMIGGAAFHEGPAVEWAPGGRGWLLQGRTFLDRERRRVTWFLKTDHGSSARRRFIGDDRLLVVRGRRGDRELVDMQIPWKQIDDSFAAMKDPNADAWLGPQAPAAVLVKVSSASDGTPPEQLAAELTRLFAARLGDDGVPIAESGAAVFSIDYSETYHPPQTISPPAAVSRLRINIPPRQIPGHTSCSMTIRFQTNGNANDLWTTTIHASAPDDAKVGQRSSVYAELGRKLQSAVLPFFIPKDNSLVSLPAVLHP